MACKIIPGTYHGVYAEVANEIGGLLPSEHVVEVRAVERVARVQEDGRRAVRGGSRPFGVQGGTQPGETAEIAAGGRRATRFVVAGVHVVGVQYGQPEITGRRRR